MKKNIVLIAVLVGVIYFLGWHLQPFDTKFFSFHDDTQVGRMKEFAFSLKTLQIPPRLAPHFSFGMGFPVFNFYAPFSYWVGGLLNVVGIPIVTAAKTSFLLAVLVMFVSMYLLISTIFSFEAGLIAATVYTSSTWIATEIFARGNIGELWFIALLPLSLYFIEKNSKEGSSVFIFIFTVITVSFMLTSHNVLSLIGFLLLVSYTLTIKNRRKNLLAILIALLLSSYFFLPLIFESSLTFAKTQAEKTPYADHFLCPIQLWSSPSWQLGGSGIGCNDGMSFKLGKTQLVLGLLGFLAYIFSSIFQKKHLPKGAGKYFVVIFFGIMSLYMMFSVSTFLWKTFSFVLAAFQFPWRFNSFFLFFISFFAGYLIWALKNRTLNIIILPLSLLLVVAMLVSSRPYFRHPWRLSYNEYYLKYVSDEYIYKKIAYTIPEYLPRTANYQIWMDYGSTQKTNTGPNSYVPFIGSNKGISITKNSSYEKQMTSLIDQDVTINTIYFPFWEITVDNKVVTPKLFDFLGRPVLSVTKSSTIRVRYRETLIEIIGNYITILTIIGLGSVALSKKLWNRLNNINT